MRKLITLFMMAMFFASFSNAQVITTSPAILQEESQNVVLTFHADQCGVTGLQNLPSSTALYVHTGVVTDKSNGGWKYVVTDWGTNNSTNKLTYVSKNTYTFKVGNIRTFYGVPSGEKILKLCFIARTALRHFGSHHLAFVTYLSCRYIDVWQEAYLEGYDEVGAL